MNKYPIERPPEEPVEVFELIAVLPHAAGGFAAERVTVLGATRDELYTAAWYQCIGSRYVSRMIDPVAGETVWTEVDGWLEDRAESQE